VKYLKYIKQFENKFSWFNKELITLKGLDIPKHIPGDFSCALNKLTSLEFGPVSVDGQFNCYDNELTSLEYCPEHVGGDFDCSDNQLISLEYCPETVGGYFWCDNNPWTNVIPYDLIKKFNIRIWDLYTHEQKEKFGSYEYQKIFLTNTPEKYKDLEPIGYNKQILEEFDWLFNAADMGLM
jgi:hypothetical protein